jgi:hypothetical protein
MEDAKMTSSITPASFRLQWLLLAALTLAAAISLSVGCRGALHSSKDMQWGASRLLLQHIDPYAEALHGYPRHLEHLSPPNYLPEFYLLLSPLAALPFPAAATTWCVLTMLLSVASMALLEKIFLLQRSHSLMLLLLLWCSVPFRTMLQVGQMSMLELFFFCIVFYAAERWASLGLGLSFAKYSFSPVAVSWFLIRGRYRLLLLSLAAPLLGLVVAWMMIATPLTTFPFEPLRVSQTSVWPGMADLMTCTEYGLKGFGLRASQAGLASYVVALAAAIGFSFTLRRRSLYPAAEFTLIAVASLFTFKHLIYDYIFLLVPLSYAASQQGRALRKPVSAAVGFFWFLIALVPRLRYQIVPTALEAAGFLLAFIVLGGLLLSLTRFILHSEDAASVRARYSETDATSHTSADNAPALPSPTRL